MSIEISVIRQIIDAAEKHYAVIVEKICRENNKTVSRETITL
jgi:hypothetical protein